MFNTTVNKANGAAIATAIGTAIIKVVEIVFSIDLDVATEGAILTAFVWLSTFLTPKNAG